MGNKPILCASVLIFYWCSTGTGSGGTDQNGNAVCYICPDAALLCPNRNPARSLAKSATSSAVFFASTFYSWPTGLGFPTNPGALFVDEASVPDPQMLCRLQSTQLQQHPYCKHKCNIYNTSNAQTNAKPIAPEINSFNTQFLCLFT